ncbi:MAG: helix-turn-helix transcriptional regulator, partial [Oscillibacter sp.]|nr:helix-turn-helix transcriptional regulator [Oscillibacter sp.]
ECFERYLVFRSHDADTIVSLLKEQEGFSLLPMQSVTIDGVDTDCLAIIIHPAGSALSVMSVYDRDTILDHLGFRTLPANCCFRITDEAGAVYMEEGMENGVPAGSYEISAKIEFLSLQMHLWVPMDYFNELLRPAYRTGTLLSLGTAVIGFLLCVVFADISTRRIRNLARSYPLEKRAEGGKRGDEVDYLARVISESHSKTETLHRQMTSGALVRAFSGMLLLRDDAQLLAPCFEEMGGEYRVALLSLPPEVNFALKTTILPENLMVPFYCEPISDKSAGVLLPAGEEALAELSAVIGRLNGAITREDGERVSCGVSETQDRADRVHIAAHQAQIALRDEKPVSLYSEKRMRRSDEFMLWVQHQRLYQCILNQEEEEAAKVIRSLMQSPGTEQELFYNILFIFRSAAEELETDVEELDTVRCESGTPLWENIAKLEELLHLLMSQASKRTEDTKSNLHAQILQYIKRNASDPELCLGQVAESFGISEKKTYTIVREETKMKFREYVLSIRMRKAANLISGTQKSIEEVAHACGYPAESTFFRVFKSYYHCTPTQYRTGGADAAPQDGAQET